MQNTVEEGHCQPKPDFLAEAAQLLNGSGLIPRGVVNFTDEEMAISSLPRIGSELWPARSVMLIGNAGSDYWHHFETWCEYQDQLPADPLDCWSAEIIGEVAAQLGGRAIGPNDRPFQPFQQWAMRAEGLRPSPLGLLMHPVYGLFHAYRGAIILPVDVMNPPVPKVIHLCDLCVEKPCIKACPVNAHRGPDFDYLACMDHLDGNRQGDCMQSGCRDRNACPHGSAYRYDARVQRFHQLSFLRGKPA